MVYRCAGRRGGLGTFVGVAGDAKPGGRQDQHPGISCPVRLVAALADNRVSLGGGLTAGIENLLWYLIINVPQRMLEVVLLSVFGMTG
jgi:hypothetical protein